MRTKILSKIKSVATAVALLCAVATLARANTITVTNTNDSGPGSLRQALAIANGGDTINFSVTGTITLTTGELTVNNSITISGPGAANLAVNGNAVSRVFHIASGRTVTISGLTITNGNDDSGGGVFNDHAVAALSTCTISNNSAFTFGGGIFNDHATLMLNDCVLSGNYSDNTGGGLYSDGSNGSASAVVNGTMLTNNSAYGGGAIYNNGDSGTATLDVANSILAGNSAVILDGGGIYNDHGHVTLDCCTISNNSAHGNGGGGIYNLGDSLGTATIEISNSTLSGNSSQFNGGAIYSIGDNGMGNVQILNSTVSGNSAANFGGGVYNHGTFGNATVHIANSTFAENSAQVSGDSIYNFDQFGMGDAIASFADSIFKATASVNFFNNGGTMTSLGYNLASDNGGGFLTGPGDQINTDPMLGPLQDNGGPTFTQALLPGSSAIDHGDPNFTPPPFNDQRGQGYLRVVNGRIDIGSFEMQTTPPLLFLNAVSRKTHGGAGTFDINLPLSGEPGVECRSGGGNYTEVFTFSNNVVSGSAAVTGGTGNVSGNPTFFNNTMTVNLAGVTDVQKITLMLTGVTDVFSHVVPPTSVIMNVLIGDVNGNRVVNASDVALTKSQVGMPVGSSNFREDVNANGAINAGDVAIVKSDVGHALPP